jgi:hypothetical protein
MKRTTVRGVLIGRENSLAELVLDGDEAEVRSQWRIWTEDPVTWRAWAEEHQVRPVDLTEYEWTFTEVEVGVAHVVGMVLYRNGLILARCGWCGQLLLEAPAGRGAALAVQDTPFRTGRWVEIDPLVGSASAVLLPLMATEKEPSNACTRQPAGQLYEVRADDRLLLVTDDAGRTVPSLEEAPAQIDRAFGHARRLLDQHREVW